MKQLLAILLFAGLSSQLVAQDSSATTFDLSACVNYALENYSDVKNALLDIESSKAKIKETRGFGLPQVESKIDFAKNIDIKQQFLPANAFDPTAPSDVVTPVGFGVEYQNDLNLQVSQLVFDKSYLLGLKAAENYKDLLIKTSEQTKIETVEKVTKAYYSVLLNVEAIKVLESQKTVLDQLLRETQGLYNNGFVEKIDVQRVQVDLNNVVIQLNTFQNNKDVSEKLLKFQMGYPIEKEAKIEGQIESELTKAKETLSWDAVNFNNRIEYRILMNQKELKELEYKNEKAAYYPKLYAFFNGGYNNGQLSFSEIAKPNNYVGYSMVGASLNIPIFTGLTTYYKVQQADIEKRKIKNDITQLENAINLEYEKNKTSFSDKLENIKFHKENMSLASEVYRVTNIKYKEGLVSNFETVNTKNAMQEAENNYYLAVYEALLSYIDYKKSNGTLYTEQ